MNSFWRDLRYAIRIFSANRLFAGVIVLSLGLAIGLTTAVFTFTNAVLLRPLPYRDANRLVLLWVSKSKELSRGISAPDLADLETQNQVFESLASFVGMPISSSGTRSTIPNPGKSLPRRP